MLHTMNSLAPFHLAFPVDDLARPFAAVRQMNDAASHRTDDDDDDDDDDA